MAAPTPAPYNTPWIPKAEPKAPEYLAPPEIHPLVPEKMTVEKAGEAGFIVETVKLPPSSKGRVLHFRSVSPPRCMIGDLDILREEIKRSKTKEILLSVEPLLGGNEFIPKSIRLTEGQLTRGIDKALVLENSFEPYHAALYLCKDDKHEERCGRKPIAKMERIFNDLTRRPPGADGEITLTPDQIYFFQYLMIEGDRVTVFNTEMTSRNYNELVAHLTGKYMRAEDATSIVRKVRKLNQDLRSFSIVGVETVFEINLPHVEMGLCQTKGPKPLFQIPKKGAPEITTTGKKVR